MSEVQSLFADIGGRQSNEVIAVLAESKHVRIERIVSHGHASPPGFWYDQEWNEWVVVISGAARLRFEGDEQTVELRAGDYLDVPAHKRHRVEWTSPEEPTVWLAVHYAG